MHLLFKFNRCPHKQLTFVTFVAALASNMRSVKELAELPRLKTIPSTYDISNSSFKQSFTPDDPVLDHSLLPVIDFSLLTSSRTHHPEDNRRANVIQELRKACQDWGFFILVNHGIPESLMNAMINACNEFFNMPQEEKLQVNGKHALFPDRYGTSFNVALDEVFFWRDFFKVIVHPPEFISCPIKPQLFSELLLEYSRRTREVAMELLKGISESLGLEGSYMHQALNLDSSFQLFVANYYPPCPQPELAIGMPPHSDHGLLTFLIDNNVKGLQIQRNNKWVNINTLPNAILVNVGDHLEIFSNGKYKSVLHRVVLNNKETRISLGFANGPALETIVCPAPQLVESESSEPAYIPMKYKDYMELQRGKQLKGKSCLDQIRKQVK